MLGRDIRFNYCAYPDLQEKYQSRKYSLSVYCCSYRGLVQTLDNAAAIQC